jgi:predicted N-acetyltransferase YhbS
MVMKQKDDYVIRSGYNEMDFEKITEMLREAFWSTGIKKAEVEQGARHSVLVVGAFASEEGQIGYSRVISDKTRFAYILDVIVNERYRRKGIGQAMVRCILNHPEMKDVYQWVLITKDAHGVYQKTGFRVHAQPENWMEIRLERPSR